MESQQYRRYTFSDVWNAARTEKNFNYAFWLNVLLDLIMESSVRYGGYVLLAFACGLIATISFFGFFVVIPAIAKPWSPWFIFNVVWGMFMLFCICFNYYMAVTTKAGKPCDEMISIYGNSEPSMDERMCKKCNFVKPGRTHHCSVCKSCVMKMDHHCPWLANCVGYKNYRYFVCFLIWVTITTSYVALVCSPTVLAPGSILIPDENFSLKETVYNAIMKPKLPSINLYASVSSFVDWESKALDREAKERKNILSDFKFASSSQDNAAPDVQRRLQHVGDEEPINRFTESAKKMAGATGVLKGRQRHHVTGLTHTHLHNPTWYYRFTHWQEYLPPEDFSLFITFVLSVGVTCGTGILMWFHLFLSKLAFFW